MRRSPFGDCRKCRGLGFAMKTDRKGRLKRGKTCRRCKGHGKRIRVGRHLYNVVAAPLPRRHRPPKKPAFKPASKG